MAVSQKDTVAADASIRAEPTANDVIRNLLRDRSFGGRVGATEAALGLIAAAFLAFVVIFAGVGVLASAWTANHPRLDRPLLIALSVLWLPLACLEWWSFRFFADGLALARHPVPVNLAIRQEPHHPLARLLVAAWWVAHAVAVVLVTHWFVDHVSFLKPTTGERIIETVVPPLFMFASAFAMNTHLLIAAYALTRSVRVVNAIWKGRIVLDLAVTLLMPVIRLPLLAPT